jgi:hypothetical protein
MKAETIQLLREVFDDNTPRPPRLAEVGDIVEALVIHGLGLNSDETVEQLVGSSIAIFPRFVTDSPGFVGKICIIIWGGDESFHTLLRCATGAGGVWEVYHDDAK